MVGMSRTWDPGNKKQKLSRLCQAEKTVGVNDCKGITVICRDLSTEQTNVYATYLALDSKSFRSGNGPNYKTTMEGIDNQHMDYLVSYQMQKDIQDDRSKKMKHIVQQ